MTIIATIRLARGQVGFYDDLTRIHLTMQNPEKHVLSGHNTRNIKTAVASKRLILVSGTLDAADAVAPASVEASTFKTSDPGEDSFVSETVNIPVKEAKQVKKEEAPAEPVAEPEAAKEDAPEPEADQEVKDEEEASKTTTRKKK